MRTVGLRWMTGLLVLGLLPGLPSLAGAASWAKIDKAELAMSTPRVSPDADAEALFWEITVWDSGDWNSVRSSITEYVRIKIFNERGRDSQSSVSIPYMDDAKLEDVAARTIRPDGSVVEVKKDAFFDRTVAKGFGVKVRSRSFAFPSVEPGCIIEYQWTYAQYGHLTHYVRLNLQREIPVRRLHMRVKPVFFPNRDYAMRMRSYNIWVPEPVRDQEGFLESTLTDVPAVAEEPYMPPERQVTGWALFYYAPMDEPSPTDYWNDVGKAVSERFDLRKSATSTVKEAARSAAGDAPVPGPGLDRIYEFCRTKIQNTDRASSGLTDSDRENLPANKSPEETLKRGRGTSRDINELFATMAVALGADARIALLADRGVAFFSRDQKLVGDLSDDCVAVRTSGTWAFYDPGATYPPCGTLPWRNEAEDALIPEGASASFVTTPLAGPEASLTRRVAQLRLSQEGTLEGDARIEFWGHEAAERKEEYAGVGAAKREEMVRDAARDGLGSAEITGIRLEHVDDTAVPVAVTYHVLARNFAQKAGARLLISPAFFEAGRKAPFAAQKRRYPVYFAHPWSERDSVRIDLPAAMDVEAGDQPETAGVPDVASRESNLRVSLASDGISYVRSLTFGLKGQFLFPPSSYSSIKGFFDLAREEDGHVVSLRAREAGK